MLTPGDMRMEPGFTKQLLKEKQREAKEPGPGPTLLVSNSSFLANLWIDVVSWS